MKSQNEVGIDVSKEIVAFAVNLGEDVSNADKNNDGKVSMNEAFGIATQHGFKLFDFLKSSDKIIKEVKDLTPEEIKQLVITGVQEVDRLDSYQKEWILGVVTNTLNLVNLGIKAPIIW